MSPMERIAKALEAIADALQKLANPLVQMRPPYEQTPYNPNTGPAPVEINPTWRWTAGQ